MKNDWNHNLIKGKIAETVFQLMFGAARGYTIIPFGYENILPQLTQYRPMSPNQKALEKIKISPDYVLISEDKKLIHLIEVKYRRNPTKSGNLNIARKMKKAWDPSWLFLATPNAFYLGEVDKIIKMKGGMKKLETKIIDQKIQDKYIKLLNEFEP